MKKLMVMAAVAVCAAAVNAATCQWVSSSVYVPVPNESKAGEYLKANSSTRVVNAVVYEFACLTAADIADSKVDPFTKYQSMTAEDLYKADINDYSKKANATSGATGTITLNGTTDFGENDHARGVIIYEFTDGVDTWYAAYAKVSDDEVGTGGKVNGILATTKTDVSAWNKVESVPEPTSGLLLLLGLGAMALRRRRA